MIPVEKIQQWMKENSIDFFLINRTDEFLNEYIAPYAERLNWISNFSGSAGRCIIEQDQAIIFIDGRYTAQVYEQVDSNSLGRVALEKTGDPKLDENSDPNA